MLNASQLVGAAVPATASFGRIILRSGAGAGSIAIPAGVFVIRVKCWGAAGAWSNHHPLGGNGGYSHADIPVTPGETLNWVSGARPSFFNMTRGGGYTGLFRGAVSQANALIIAGGGGGRPGTSGFGGIGGGTTGSSGSNDTATGGGGGTQAAAGAAGTGALANGNAGSGMNGGVPISDSGGGGDGYYGGGSGGADTNATRRGGGGGGSGFASGLSAVTQQGIAGTTTDIDYVWSGASPGNAAAIEQQGGGLISIRA